MDLDSVRASRHCKKLPIQKLSCTLQARQRGRGKEGPPCGKEHGRRDGAPEEPVSVTATCSDAAALSQGVH